MKWTFLIGLLLALPLFPSPSSAQEEPAQLLYTIDSREHGTLSLRGITRIGRGFQMRAEIDMDAFPMVPPDFVWFDMWLIMRRQQGPVSVELDLNDGVSVGDRSWSLGFGWTQRFPIGYARARLMMQRQNRRGQQADLFVALRLPEDVHLVGYMTRLILGETIELSDGRTTNGWIRGRAELQFVTGEQSKLVVGIHYNGLFAEGKARITAGGMMYWR